MCVFDVTQNPIWESSNRVKNLQWWKSHMWTISNMFTEWNHVYVFSTICYFFIPSTVALIHGPGLFVYMSVIENSMQWWAWEKNGISYMSASLTDNIQVPSLSFSLITQFLFCMLIEMEFITYKRVERILLSWEMKMLKCNWRW